MANTEFVYTTYIKTTPERVWAAITNPEFSRQYWVNGIVSDWKKGSKWQHVANTEGCSDMLGGEVLESLPPRKLHSFFRLRRPRVPPHSANPPASEKAHNQPPIP